MGWHDAVVPGGENSVFCVIRTRHDALGDFFLMAYAVAGGASGWRIVGNTLKTFNMARRCTFIQLSMLSTKM